MKDKNKQKYPKLPPFEEFIAKGLAGQKEILKRQLANGVAICYYDKNDNFVEERPDGSIVILKKAEEDSK